MIISNKHGIIMTGRVSKSATLRTTKSNKLYCTFSVAVSSEADGAQFFDCKAFGSLAAYCGDLEKGDSFAGSGHFEEREYNGKQYKNFMLEWAHSPALATSAPVPAPDTTEGKENAQNAAVKPDSKGKTQWKEEDADEDELPF